MKKIFSLIVSTIMFFGCSESFLDKVPEDTLSPAVYYKNSAQIKGGVISVYKILQALFQVDQVPWTMEVMSDDANLSYNTSVFNSFDKTNANSLDTYWSNFYKMIVNANDIIGLIDNFIPADDADAVNVKALRGEACFLRALAYFYLSRFYGDLPMITKSISNPSDVFGIGRTSVNDIYTKVVIPDLQYASENCYKKGDAAIASEGARATQGAALTILAKVYLTINDNANAAATLKKLIVDKAAGTYALLSDYSKIWLPANKFNSESIFEVNYNVTAGAPSYWYRSLASTLAVAVYKLSATQGTMAGGKGLLDEFVAYQEWTRYSVSIDSGFTPNNGLYSPFCKKLMPPPKLGFTAYDKVGCDYNYMITRYADALLMYAEALMNLGQKDVAVTYVNQVRARVNMAPITTADLNIYRILHERRMELTFEGHRYFDLVRAGKAIEIISADLMSHNEFEGRAFRSIPIPEYQLLLPISVSEIQKDETLTQNPGY
jgi:starch-binding outer membrane protein, SusD/RagB family